MADPEKKVEDQEPVNYLEMSDEDMANLELPAEQPNVSDDASENSDDNAANENSGDSSDDGRELEPGSDEGNSDAGRSDDKSGESNTEGDDSGTDGRSESGEPAGGSGESDPGTESGVEGNDNSGKKAASNDSSSESESGSGKAKSGEESGQNVESASQEIDPAKGYAEIMAPFKANGREMQAKSPAEAIRLMQMGANYNTKMASLKPSLKMVKMLQNNDLLTEEKLSFLIDLSKNDPTAITKLIKDSGYDPLKVDLEKDSGYKSKAYTVSDSEVDLDQVLQEIQTSDAGKRTLDIITNRWDDASKEVLVKNPNSIRRINEQVANGVFDEIMAKIDHAKMLGEFTGISDVEAYKQMGEHMQVNRLFKGMAQKQADSANLTNTNTKVTPNVKADDLQLKNRKKAASATKGTGGDKKKLTGIDVLSMSDEDFAKLSAPT